MKTENKVSVDQVSKKLIKIEPRISTFMGVKASKKGKQELVEAHNADNSSVVAAVHLLPKHLQKKLRTHANGIRELVSKYSIPYDNGSRIMKASNYPKLRSELDKKINAYAIFVQDEIVANYDAIVNMARIRLNGLFDEVMFPSRDEMASKYGVHLYVEQMPNTDAASFVIDGLNQQQIDEIRTNLRSEIESNLKEGQKRAIAELREAIVNIYEKTKKEDGARYKAAIRNLVDKCNNIDNVNVLEIPELTKVAGEVKQKLGRVSASALKANSGACKKVAEDATDLMSALDAINL